MKNYSKKPNKRKGRKIRNDKAVLHYIKQNEEKMAEQMGLSLWEGW